MGISQLITGLVMIIFGAGLFILGIFISPRVMFWIYGLIIFILGIIIFFNRKEDKIEEIKSVNKLKGRKK